MRYGAITIIVVSLAGLTFAGSANATDVYVTVFGSINFPNTGSAAKFNPGDPDADPVVEDSITRGTLARNTNYDLGAAVGFVPWEDDIGRLRIEGEISYKSGNLGDLVLFDAVRFSTGSQNVVSFMVNGYMDFKELGGRFTPYLGVGAGVAMVKTDLTYIGSDVFDADPALRWDMDGSDSVFAFQVMGGVSVPISGRLTGYAEVRYFRSSNSTVAVTEQIVGDPAGTFTTRYATILTRFGLRFGF